MMFLPTKLFLCAYEFSIFSKFILLCKLSAFTPGFVKLCGLFYNGMLIIL